MREQGGRFQDQYRFVPAVYLRYNPGQRIALRGIGLAFIAPLAWMASLENNLLLGRPIPRVDGLPSLHFVPLTRHIIEIKSHPQLANVTLDLVDQKLDLVLVAAVLDDIKVPQEPYWVGEVFVLSWLPASPWETCLRDLHEILVVGMEPAVLHWIGITHLELTAVQVQGSSIFLHFVAHDPDQVACFTISVTETRKT
jgi:hypothetical protein